MVLRLILFLKRRERKHKHIVVHVKNSRKEVKKVFRRGDSCKGLGIFRFFNNIVAVYYMILIDFFLVVWFQERLRTI